MHIFFTCKEKIIIIVYTVTEAALIRVVNFPLIQVFLAIQGIKLYSLYWKCPNLFSILILILKVKNLFQCSKLMSAWPPNLFCQYCTQIGSCSIFINNPYICLVDRFEIWILFLPIQNSKSHSGMLKSNLFFEIKLFHSFGMAVNNFCKLKTFLEHWTICSNYLGLSIDYQLQHHSDTQYQHLSIFGTLEAYCYTLHHCCSKLFGSQVHLGLMNIYCFRLTQTMIPKYLYRIWEFIFCYLVYVRSITIR